MQGAPAGSVSVEEQIRRLEELPAIVNNDDFVSPCDMNMVYEAKAAEHMWYRDQAATQRVRQHQGFLEELQVEQSLKRLEAKWPSHHHEDEVARLDRWYAKRCWASPKLEKARLDSYFFERYTLDQALLTMGRLEVKPYAAFTKQGKDRGKDLSQYGSPIDMDAVHEEALEYQAGYRARFDERKAKIISIKERSKQRKGSGRVTDSAVVKQPASTLTGPVVVNSNVGDGVVALLTNHAKSFTSLNTIISPGNVAAMFKGFDLTNQHGGRGGYFPLLE